MTFMQAKRLRRGDESEERKLSHAAVSYGQGRPTGDHCGICAHWRGGHCAVVKDPVSATGWCNRFRKGS